MIKKILIANRGEIALRVQRTAQKLNIKTVAVYAIADSHAAFVYQADEAVLLEGNALSDTYLNINKIIAVAKATKADAIHPGYGFLSENTDFVNACHEAGIIFIGPSARAMNAMGNKIAARETAQKVGVPITPGITGAVETLLKNYQTLSFPLLIKAAAGGGGKGMRVVHQAEEMQDALEATPREAKNYFGDDTVYIEKYIENPRHIEVQIIGDQQGNVIHLFERECSLQRRHQKIVEEAPSATLTPQVRENICQAAIQLAKSIGYYSAGTLEFLLDEDLGFYFLEMNTRIQVEHPVTELTTGIDIVEQQIKVAKGEAFPFSQKDIYQKGHAIECRIYAEDPEQHFLPSPGQIHFYQEPSFPNPESTTSNTTIRIDGMQLKSGDTVTGDFDPMISKFITWAPTREAARMTMISALRQYHIKGISTNIQFLSGLLQHKDFIDNNISTKYIDLHLDTLNNFFKEQKKQIDISIPIASALIHSFRPESFSSPDIWQTIGFWRHSNIVSIMMDGQLYPIHLISQQYPKLIFEMNGHRYVAILETLNGLNATIRINDQLHEVDIYKIRSGCFEIGYAGFPFTVTREDISSVDEQTYSQSETISHNPWNIVSPMPGKVIKINVQEGEPVQKGDVLLIVEAMKMENNIVAVMNAQVESISVSEGDKVDASTVLIKLKEH